MPHSRPLRAPPRRLTRASPGPDIARFARTRGSFTGNRSMVHPQSLTRSPLLRSVDPAEGDGARTNGGGASGRKPPLAFPGDTLDQLGKYHLIAFLARGGMADVYLGVVKGPVGFSKLLVVKELRHEALEEELYVTMFLNEARLAARLNHPNVVQTIEVGGDGPRRFIAMEYLDGQPLNRILQRARKKGVPLDPAMHMRVVADVLTALAYAHSLTDFDGTPLGIVHRDVSPQNVFVGYEGNVKLIDFGVAKTTSAFSQQTMSGVLKGKLRYMAPEQTTRRPIDQRADIFAAGVMLWEAAAGRGPWEGGEDITVLRSLMSGSVPRLRVARPDVDPALAAIVDRATCADPRSRYPDALTMRDDVEDYLDTHAGPPCGGRDLAEFVAALFVDDRLALRALVEAQLRALDRDGEGDRAGQSGMRLREVTTTPLDEPPPSHERAPISGVAPSTERAGEEEPRVVEEPLAVVVSGVTEAAAALSEEESAPHPFPRPNTPVALALDLDAPRSVAGAAKVRGPSSRAARSVVVALAPAILAAVVVASYRGVVRASGPTPVTVSVLATSPREDAPLPPPVSLAPLVQPALIDLVVRASPPFARITVDGHPAENPFAASYPKDASPHRIEARAQGYDPKGEDVSYGGDVVVELRLHRHVLSAVPTRAAIPAMPDGGNVRSPAALPAPELDAAGGRAQRHPIETKDPYAVP